MKTEFSTQIKLIRTKRNLSQKRFGKKIAVSDKTVSAYERGLCTPSLKVLKRIQRVYKEELLPIKAENTVYLQERIAAIKTSLRDIENIISGKLSL